MAEAGNDISRRLDSGALPSIAHALGAVREHVVLDLLVTVLKGVRESLASAVVVSVARCALAAGRVAGAGTAVVHACDAVVVAVFVEGVHALLADTLGTAHVAIVTTVVIDFAASTILQNFVVVSATLAGGQISGAVDAVVNAACACTVTDGVAIGALLAFAVDVADIAVGHGALGAQIVVVHVVAVRALLASELTDIVCGNRRDLRWRRDAGVAVDWWVGGGCGGVTLVCLAGHEAHGAAVQVAIVAHTIVVNVVTVSALQAFTFIRLVLQAVRTVQASSDVAVTAHTVNATVLVVVAAISGLFVAIGIVTAAVAVAFIVVEEGDSAEVRVPTLGKCDTVSVVLLLEVAISAFHAVILAKTVFAVVEIRAGLAGVVGAMVGAHATVRVAATEFRAAFVFEAGATVVVGVFRVAAAVANVGKTLAGNEARTLVDVEGVTISADGAGIGVTARITVVHAGDALAVGTSTNVVTSLADFALGSTLASSTVAATVAVGNAGAVDDLVAGFASVALGGTALQAVVRADIAGAGGGVQREASHALVALRGGALFAVLGVTSGASTGGNVAVVTIHARLADNSGRGLVVDQDCTGGAGRAAINFALDAGVVDIEVIAVHALVAFSGGVSVLAVQAAVQRARGAGSVRVTVDTSVSGVAVDDLVLNTFWVNSAASAVALVVVEEAHIACVKVPAVWQRDACTPWVAVSLVVSNVASSAETLAEAVGAVIEIRADIVVEEGTHAAVAAAETSGVAATVLCILLVTGASAAIVGGCATVADVGDNLFGSGARARHVIESESVLANVAGFGICAGSAVGRARGTAGGVTVVEQHDGVTVLARFALVVLFAFVTVVAAVFADQTARAVQFWFIEVITLQASADIAVGVDGSAFGAVVGASAATSVLCLVVTFSTGVASFIATGIDDALTASSDRALNTSLDLR